MKVTLYEEPGSLVIKTQGRFEDGDCQALKDVLEKSSQSLNSCILLDLKDLHNITTTGQRVLLSYSAHLQTLKRPLVFFNVNPAIMAAFEDSGLAKVISIAGNLQEAKALAQAKTK